MTDRKRLITLMATTLFVFAACASGASPTPVPADGGATPSPAGGASTVPATETPSTATSAPTDPPGGGGTAVGVCELVTADEVGGIVGKTVVMAVVAGPPDTCDIQADGAPIAAFVFMEGPSFGFAFDAWAADPSAVDVPGIGDRAVYVAASELLIVKRGDRLFSIAVYDVDLELDQRTEMMKAIARLAANRM